MMVNITEYDGLDLELFFCTEILKLGSLHYGLWKSGEKLTIQNLKRAQKRYTDTLIRIIPNDVRRILDVGCGIGDLSRALVKKGYSVTAISPDRNHQRYFREKVSGLSYFRSRFEDFKGDGGYDLIIMSESQNYFDMEIGLRQCRKLLNPGGYLLVSGMFRLNDIFADVRNKESEYVASAQVFGFKVVMRIDITDRVLPNMQMVHEGMTEYVAPSKKMVNQFLKSSAPIKFWFMKLFFRRQISELSRIYNYYTKRTDPKVFKENVCYVRLLFRQEQR